MTAQYPQTGLRKRIVLSFLAVGFLPLLVGLLVTYWTGTLHLRESMGQNFQGLASEASRKIDLVLEREIEGKRHLSVATEILADLEASNRRRNQLSDDDLARVLTEERNRWEGGQNDPFKRRILSSKASSLLRSYMRTKAATYLAFFVTDEQGAVIASSNGAPGYLHRDETWWKAAYKNGLGDSYIGTLFYSDPDQAFAMTMAVPVMNEETQKAVGVLAVVHDIQKLLQEPIHAIQFGKSGHAMLIDSEGLVLICPFLPTGTLLNDRALVASVTSSTPGWTLAADDGHGGTGSIIGFAPAVATSMVTNASTGTQWHSFIRQDPKELYAPIDSLLWSATSSGVALIGFVALLGLILSKKLVKPIQVLQQGAEQIGKGNLDVRLSIRTNDEIEQLAGAFNQMAEKLRESYSTLEQRVMERTSQLSALNAIAASTNRSLELQEIVESAIEKILDVMQFQYGAMWLWNAKEDRLVLQASRGAPSELIKRFKDVAGGEMIVGRVASSGRRVIVSDAAHDAPADDLVVGGGWASWVAVPLISKGRILGTFIGASSTPRTFSQPHLNLLDSMCSHLSVSIENAKLYTRTRAMVEQLREAEHFKEAFFSNISHELRTPLTSIIGYSETLLAHMGGELTLRQREAVTNIHTSGTMLVEIIGNLLDLSKIRAGKMELHFGEFSLSHLVESSLKAMAPLALQKGQVLTYPATAERFMIHADQIKVKQILLNLLSNAVKFTPVGGRIAVDVRECTLDRQPAIELAVVDQGIGIKATDIDTIFNEFTQVDSSYTRAYAGSGLGLPIVKQFVEMHGGRVTVKSQPGKGSRFSVVLPRRLEPEPPPEITGPQKTTDQSQNGHAVRVVAEHGGDASSDPHGPDRSMSEER